MKELHELIAEMLSSVDTQEAADRLGVGSMSISQFCTGDQKPAALRIALLAKHYGVERLPELLLAAAVAEIKKDKHSNNKDKGKKQEALSVIESFTLQRVGVRHVTRGNRDADTEENGVSTSRLGPPIRTS